MGEQYVTLRDAATILGLGLRRVQVLAKQGRLEAYPCCPNCGADVSGRDGVKWMQVIPLSTVVEYRDKPLPDAGNEKRRRAARALKEKG